MGHRIVLNFEDEATHFIHATPGETVADAAYRWDINIPLDCRDGVCGTYKCLAEAGRYALGQDYINDTLSIEEATRGYVLTCQVRAESGYVLCVPAPPTLCRTGQARYRARISEIQQLLPSTIGSLLHGEALVSLAFLLGQYANLQVPGSEQHRAYSFSSLVKDDKVSSLIRNVPGRLMDGFLSSTVRAGDNLTIDDPLDGFYLREIHRPLLMLADGTGLVLFAMMFERIIEQSSTHPLHLAYGVTHDVDLVGFERPEAFAERILGFTWSACVASADSDCPCRGHMTEHIIVQHLHEGDVDIYLCGPPSMVEAVERYLREQGVRPVDFYYEKFVANMV